MSPTFMHPRSLQLAAFLAILSVPALLPAQETTGIQDERMQAIASRKQQEEWFGPRNKVTVAFHILNSGGTVDFNNLGAVPAKIVPPASEGAVNRVYDTGYVLADSPRQTEVDANGNQVSTPGGRYTIYGTQSDGSQIPVAEILGYQTGVSREWKEYTQNQFEERPGYLALTNYSTTSEGGHFTDKMGNAAGVELEYTRMIGRVSRRFQWGFTGGATINSISGQTSGSVTATLNSHTDYYLLHGTPDLAPTGGPTFGPYVVNGVLVNESGMETTVPVNQTPDESLSTNSATPGGVTVDGRWTVKGAYFMVKLGPSLRAQFNDHWEMTASAGFAGAYAGTTYTAAENFSLSSLPAEVTPGVTDIQQSTTAKFLTGYYADLTVEWAANERTGLFGGITAQQLSDYDQMVAERVARVDLGSAIGIRGGVSISF